jgi:UDP-N-acetylglucosamine 4-epimerase
MSRYDDVSAELRRDPRCWLVTGAAGFIGSHVVEGLLALGQRVIGVDNFATGSRDNVMAAGGGNPLFTFHEGDCADAAFMDMACAGVDVISHQAALGSVPRSLDDPFATHRANVDGFVQVLLSGRAASVRRIVYASSSSVYGDDPSLPKREDVIGRPLSPYAATKRIDEIYADAFGRCFGLSCVGLRYFNVFGPRQERTGP